jgi:hypothetical protein
MNKIKCFIVWLVLGHSNTAEGEKVSAVWCRGCNKLVFKR